MLILLLLILLKIIFLIAILIAIINEPKEEDEYEKLIRRFERNTVDDIKKRTND